jgi:RNA polymerase sigma factor (sigma-70 family)
MEPMALTELLERVQAGDPAAEAEFVRRFTPTIRAVASIRRTALGVQGQLDSEDVAQSVLREAFAHARQGGFAGRGPGEVIAWLRRVALNARREKIRQAHAARRDCRRNQGDATEAPLADPRQTDPAEELAERDEVRRHMETVAQVCDNPLDVRIALLRADGHSCAEVAEQVALTPGAVRVRFQRILQKLRDFFGG